MKRLHILLPPVFDDNDVKTRHAELLYYSAIIIFSFILFGLNWVFRTEVEKSMTWVLGALAVAQIPVLLLIRLGYVDTISLFLLTSCWGVMTIFGRNVAGLHDVALMGYIIIFFGSAILLSWRATIIYTLLSIAAIWWLAFFQMKGTLVPVIGTLYRIAMDLTVIFVLMFLVVVFFIRALTKATKNAQYEMSERIRVESEREKLIIQLSNEVAERKQAQDELQKLVMTDFLTGLFNRRHFFSVAKKEIAKAVRYHKHLSVIIFDLDRFKDINDTYGHSTGDQALIQLGALLRDTLREPDISARYGGEEFIILLPETDYSQAMIVAERLRKQVQDTPVRAQEFLVHITISVGVAGRNENDGTQTVDQLITKADQALYKAKKGGRNRVAYY